MAKLTKEEQVLVRKTKLEGLEYFLELLDKVNTLDDLKGLKRAIAISLAANIDADTPEEVSKNLKEMFGIDLK